MIPLIVVLREEDSKIPRVLVPGFPSSLDWIVDKGQIKNKG